MRVLLIEDDAEMATTLAAALRGRGDTVRIASTLGTGLEQVTGEAFDVAVVDRCLPDGDGLQLVRQLRARDDRLPILMLTALGEMTDRVQGLEAGADDYLAKPFGFSELNARLQALVRRSTLSAPETLLQVGELRMDLVARRVSRAGRPIDLSEREFRLLEYFMRRAGGIVTRAMLLEQVWGFHFDPKTTVVETHISRLRARIDRDFPTEMLQTVRGLGYVLRAD